MLWLTPDDFVPWKHRRPVVRTHKFDAVWAMAGDGFEIMEHLDGTGTDTLQSGLQVQVLALHMAWTWTWRRYAGRPQRQDVREGLERDMEMDARHSAAARRTSRLPFGDSCIRGEAPAIGWPRAPDSTHAL
ncbi:hypothetical protein ACQKWADRAFT_305710 [Trichoderma austrokoningii]